MFKQPAPSSQGFAASSGFKSSQPPLASSGSSSGMMQISQPIGQNPSPLKSYQQVKTSQQPQKLDQDSAQLKQKLSSHEPIQTHSNYARNDLSLIHDLFKVYSSYCTKYQQFVENIGGHAGP
jgi:hypothetical protein